MINSRHVLPGMTAAQLRHVIHALRRSERHCGRPWASSLPRRVLVTCWHLRANLTVRELASVFAILKSQVHRIIVDITPRLAALLGGNLDRRWSWIVDGTLIPTRDHSTAAKSKNYRWSCNLQLLVRRADLRVIRIDGAGPGNRNDPVHYRRSAIEALCRRHRRVLADGGYRGIRELVTPRFHGRRILRNRTWRIHRRRRARVEHAIARLKNWRSLRDHRRQGVHLLATARAVAFLHNLQITMRDSP